MMQLCNENFYRCWGAKILRAHLLIGSIGALLLLTTANAEVERLRLEGSDLLAPLVAKLVDSSAFNPGSTAFEVQLTGSAAAYHSLLEGNLELGLVFDDGERLAESGSYRKLPLAYLVLQVVVHERNPLESVRLDRLRGIFGEAEGVDFRRWGDLGVMTWSDRVIRAVRVDSAADLSGAYFQRRILREPVFKGAVQVETTPMRMLDAVRSQEAAIGLAGLLPVRAEGWKVLSIEFNPGDSPVAPSLDSVHFGPYSLALPLVIVFPESRQAEFLSWILPFYSDAFADLLRDAGYFPLPRSARERMRLDLSFTN